MDSLPLSPVCVWKIKYNIFHRNTFLPRWFLRAWILHISGLFILFFLLSYFSEVIISLCPHQMSMRVWTITWPIDNVKALQKKWGLLSFFSGIFPYNECFNEKKWGKASSPSQVTKMFPILSNNPALNQGSFKVSVWSAISDVSLVACIKWNWTSVPWGED